MAQQDLQIRVDTDVQLDSRQTPQQILSALKRRLRHSSSGGSGGEGLPALLETREGVHRLPQGLLSWVTEACQRKDVSYQLDDRRAVVTCRAMRLQERSGERQKKALRQLMARDSGVLVGRGGRVLVAAELMAARQQRSLVAVASEASARSWLAQLQQLLGLEAPHVAPLAQASAETRVVVCGHAALARQSPEALRCGFGMVLFDAVDEVEPQLLLRAIRGTGARYLLGLAREATRRDPHHDQILLSLGGVVCQLDPAAHSLPLLPVCRVRVTSFSRPYNGQQYQALVGELARDEPRSQLIVDDLVQEAGAGHACLVLSERRTQLELLASLLPGELAVETLTSAVGPAQRRRIIQRFEAGELQVLLSTSQIAQDTITTHRVSRLFLTFPFTYVRKLEKPLQGLIQPGEGQRDAVLYDYHDVQMPPLVRSAEKRQKFIKRFRQEVEQKIHRKSQMTLPLG